MDIISLPVEYDNTKIDGKYRLVAIASQRAKDLSLGSKPKIQTKSKKVTSIAIEAHIKRRSGYEKSIYKVPGRPDIGIPV